jgi:hypothetical protein
MIRRLQLVPVRVQLQEHLLGYFFSSLPIMQKVPSDGIHHGFVGFNGVGESRQTLGFAACQVRSSNSRPHLVFTG